MKALLTFALLLVSGFAICGAQNDVPVTPVPEPTTTTPPPTTPTTAKTTPSTSTTTTTTTEPPHTTTPTVAPTTTAAPTTTTTEPPKPTPVPEPEVGSWTYTNTTTNQTCVLTQMALQLNVTYRDAADKPAHVLYDVPKSARVVNGSCADNAQFIELLWGPESVEKNRLTVSFKRNTTEHEFALSGVSFYLVVFGESFPNAKDNQTLTLENKQTLFKTPTDMSYHCNRPQMLNLTASDNSTSTVTVSKLQFEAFHNKQNTKFSIAKDCDAIDTPDIVPIAVGCALILLIVIVLIAYLAGRRSTRSRGYLSM